MNNISYNTNGDLKYSDDNSKLHVCRPQKRLYEDILFGIINEFGINISKLKLSLMSLFPASFNYLTLNLLNIDLEEEDQKENENENKFNIIKYDNIECLKNKIKKLSLRIRLVVYHNLDGILYINQYREYNIPILNLPKLSVLDTIIDENSVEKLFVSQLSRIPDIRVNIDNGITNINLITLGAKTLSIQIKNNDCNIICGDRSADCLLTLTSFGLKYSHILKLALNNIKVVFLKKEWNKLNYITGKTFIYNIKFGRRRLIKFTKNFSVLQSNSFFIIDNVNNIISRRSNKNVLNSIMLWTKKYVSIFNVAITSNRYIHNFKIKFNKIKNINFENNINEILASDLSSIKISLASRNYFNSIFYNKLDYVDYDLDLLTKRDLFSVLNNLKIKFNKHNNVRIVRGIGDIIIDIVKDIIMDIIHPHTIRYTFNIFLFDEISLLNIINRIQPETDKSFVNSGLCQYIDQVNSLSELSHKLRLTCLGEGGVSIHTAEMSIRGVQKWYFGKICPIDSPEGENIGLVSVLASYANIDINGNITTAYWKVYKGIVSNNIIYLNNENKYVTSLLPLANNYNLAIKKILCLKNNKPYISNINNIDLYSILNDNIFSHAINLIPFLTYNDATRALMAANMQKQAVPLLSPQYPLVGTGLESTVMKNTNTNIVVKSHLPGIVVNIDSSRVIVYELKNNYRVYIIPNPKKNNQNMCIRYRVVVNLFQVVKTGDIIAECQSSNNGDISLGANLLVAFMCWNGFNYEDSVLISSDIVNKGILNSFHIIELETKINSSKYGNDILTNNLYFYPRENYDHLPNNGIVQMGRVVKEGDILVGKLSSTLNEDIELDEENEFYNINEEDFYIKSKKPIIKKIDSSLRVPEGIDFATVLEVTKINIKNNNKNKKTSSDDNDNEETSEESSSYEEYIYAYNSLNKNHINTLNQEFKKDYLNKKYINYQENINLLNILYDLKLTKLTQLYLLKFNNQLFDDKTTLTPLISKKSKILYIIKIKLLVRKSTRAGDKICGRHGNKGVISRVTLKEDMPYMADGTPIDIVLNPLSVPSRMNLGQILEVNFGLISYKFSLEFKKLLEMYKINKNKTILKTAINKLYELNPNINLYNNKSILKIMHELSNGVKFNCPSFQKNKNKHIKNLYKRLGFKNLNGQIQLYDGRTGLPFDRKSTVGIIYVFKLNHLVDDKMHARSIGPYSSITQQPLKGKANKGGQRVGEMEIWALQSYGAAYMLKEILTSKSDDSLSREIMYKSILTNNPILLNTWSESLLVLIKELCSLCIKVKFYNV
ncbi:MAG: hypothetical protein ACKESC_01200 [Candidatus Hodgkinia cicadicola]